ncbi:MAG: aspartate carbamoyltransferase [Anaerolineales bacterium]|nr:aspartate carbamoyltransferase [Anaerolineales bacterium]
MLRRLIGLLLITIVALVGCQSHTVQHAAPERLAEVADRGAEVMPFDLERTTHIFEKTESGGLQQVISDDGDAAQIELIRSHLAEEVERFSQGDFHDPQMIHGENMAGLHQLMMGYQNINLEYSDIENGAQILYTTDDAEMVTALHTWFDAQLSDHGPHAQPATQ